MSQPVKWEKDSKYAYVEFDWGDYNFVNCGKKLQFKLGFYYGDIWDPTNDPSYKDLKIYKEDDAFFGTGNEVRTDNICVYNDGVLIGGIEPDGTVPSDATPTVGKNEETTTQPTKTTEASDRKLLRGDVDCSGRVDVSDSVLLARMIAEDRTANITSDGKINADCDGSKGITSGDVIAILQHIAKIKEFND